MAAPSFLRSTTRIDHNPEICKPYFETGYCPYGDTCIYIHDRTDYKSGHQQDLEYERERKNRARKLESGQNQSPQGQESDEDAYEIKSVEDEPQYEVDSDGFPYVCPICQDDAFDNPVQTQCDHIFCEECALTHYRNNKNCSVCGKETNGVFNELKNKKKFMEKLSKRQNI